MGAETSKDLIGAAMLSQTHLRLTPELRRSVYGPHNDAEPAVMSAMVRHPILKGLEKTDIIHFGGALNGVALDGDAEALMTFIPAAPQFPPESAWMRVTKTTIPVLVVNTLANGSRIVFMPADLDRRFAATHLADHADLLANAVRWSAKDDIPITADAVGLLDCSVYQQPGRMIVHITNLIPTCGDPDR